MARLGFRRMSLDELLTLRDRVDTAVSSKVAQERRSLEEKLSKLEDYQARKVSTKARGLGRRGRKLSAKYRNPRNRSETWAGRGLRPRWLTAALKTGKRLEDFLVQRRGRKPKGRVGRPPKNA